MENLTFTVYDLAFVSFFAIFILIGYMRGLFRLVRPVIAAVLARFISTAIRTGYKAEATEAILKAFRDSKVLPQSDRLLFGNEIVPGAVASVAIFFASYLVIRFALGFVFYIFKPNNRLSFQLDKILGILVMLVLAVAVTCIVVKSLTILSAVGFESAVELSEGIDNGVFSRMIKNACMSLYGKIPKTLF